MARNTVRNVGTMGIVRDIKPQLLPPEVWTNGRNIRFSEGRVEGMGGVIEIVPDTAIDIQNVGLVTGVENTFVLFTDLSSIYAYTGFTTTDVSGTTYTESLDSLFQFQVFNGLILAIQENDIPQEWDGDTANNFGNLTNWNTNWRARFMRPYNQILIALRLIESGVRYDHKIRWSHPAESGTVPSTWDETDATKLAGEFTFADTQNGLIKNGMQLDNRFYIYKSSAIWALTFVGGVEVFSRRLVVEGLGLDVERSLVYVPRGPQNTPVHFFAGTDGFYFFDGARFYPVFEEVFEREYLTRRNPENYIQRAFSVVNHDESEVWFCFPTEDNDFCNLALVLDYQSNKYSLRELGGCSTIASGINVGPGGNAIKTTIIPYDDGTFFDDGTGHLVLTQLPARSSLIEVCQGKAFSIDEGNKDYDGSDYVSYVEKQSLAMVKYDSRDPEATIVDYNRRKLIVSITPKLHSGQTRFEVGVQETENESVDWVYSVLLPENTYKHDLIFPITGRFISFRFTSVGDKKFELGGFDYDVQLLGMF